MAFAFKSGISLQLFLGAKLLIESPTTVKLSDIKDVNNWVGESQWSKDHAYQGTFDEFRIYNVALTSCQLHTVINRGPDARFSAKVSIISYGCSRHLPARGPP